MVEPHMRGALPMDVPTKFSDLRTAVKRLLSPSSPSAWDPQIQHILRKQLSRNVYSHAYDLGWLICISAISVRKIVRTHFLSFGNDQTGLVLLENWLGLLEEIYRSNGVPVVCDELQRTLAIRKLFSATAIVDAFSAPWSRWQAQMTWMLWQFIDLFADRDSTKPATPSRDRALRELSLLLCREPLECVFPELCSDVPSIRERVFKILRVADESLGLHWVLQYLFMRSRRFCF